MSNTYAKSVLVEMRSTEPPATGLAGVQVKSAAGTPFTRKLLWLTAAWPLVCSARIRTCSSR